jgi:hypothetical protein
VIATGIAYKQGFYCLVFFGLFWPWLSYFNATTWIATGIAYKQGFYCLVFFGLFWPWLSYFNATTWIATGIAYKQGFYCLVFLGIFGPWLSYFNATTGIVVYLIGFWAAKQLISYLISIKSIEQQRLSNPKKNKSLLICNPCIHLENKHGPTTHKD